MIIYKTSDKLPNPGEYVLAYFPNQPWISNDTLQHKWVVVQFVKGISLVDRAKLSNADPRKTLETFGDECGNNLVPYKWKPFGPDSFFGQEASCWCYLPTHIN